MYGLARSIYNIDCDRIFAWTDSSRREDSNLIKISLFDIFQNRPIFKIDVKNADLKYHQYIRITR